MKRLKFFFVFLLLFVGCSDDSTGPGPDPGPLSVVSWNIYLGADLNPVLTSPPTEIPLRAAEVWQQIQQTDFPGRAVQIAAEIKTHLPHVIGLQEVSLYRLQSPGDAAVGGTDPATIVAFDFLDILLQVLQAQGLEYEAAAVIENFDVEVRMLAGAQEDDIRLTDRDVILVRKGITTTEVKQQNFTAQAQLELGGGPALPFKRGWTSLVIDFFGQQIRIMNTHLEGQVFSEIQQLQATELMDEIATETRPAILMGDFNSDASGSQTPTYGQLVASGCEDLWKSSGGMTCCQDPNLKNDMPALSQRIDFIFSVGTQTPVSVDMKIIGTTKAALWPSDHAGLLAQLRYN